jgi:hypothetical protein
MIRSPFLFNREGPDEPAHPLLGFFSMDSDANDIRAFEGLDFAVSVALRNQLSNVLNGSTLSKLQVSGCSMIVDEIQLQRKSSFFFS